MTPAELAEKYEAAATGDASFSIERSDAALIAAALRLAEAAPACHPAHESSAAYRSYADALAAYRAARSALQNPA